ncbi:MAG: hypothetical protein Ta2G_00700 [Termitinemataceae bacterium]|nr:MAG: hypothetical protein Ta2G_00700 [Termitinemataceae bacterium]
MQHFRSQKTISFILLLAMVLSAPYQEVPHDLALMILSNRTAKSSAKLSELSAKWLTAAGEVSPHFSLTIKVSEKLLLLSINKDEKMNLFQRNIEYLFGHDFSCKGRKDGHLIFVGPNGGIKKISPFKEHKSIRRGNSKYKPLNQDEQKQEAEPSPKMDQKVILPNNPPKPPVTAISYTRPADTMEQKQVKQRLLGKHLHEELCILRAKAEKALPAVEELYNRSLHYRVNPDTFTRLFKKCKTLDESLLAYRNKVSRDFNDFMGYLQSNEEENHPF